MNASIMNNPFYPQISATSRLSANAMIYCRSHARSSAFIPDTIGTDKPASPHHTRGASGSSTQTSSYRPPHKASCGASLNAGYAPVSNRNFPSSVEKVGTPEKHTVSRSVLRAGRGRGGDSRQVITPAVGGRILIAPQLFLSASRGGIVSLPGDAPQVSTRQPRNAMRRGEER